MNQVRPSQVLIKTYPLLGGKGDIHLLSCQVGCRDDSFGVSRDKDGRLCRGEVCKTLMQICKGGSMGKEREVVTADWAIMDAGERRNFLPRRASVRTQSNKIPFSK